MFILIFEFIAFGVGVNGFVTIVLKFKNQMPWDGLSNVANTFVS